MGLGSRAGGLPYFRIVTAVRSLGILGVLLCLQAAAIGREYNLLRNTRLVAGLPSGWSVTGYNTSILAQGDDINYGTDGQTIGPSGFPAFLIDVLNRAGVPSSWGMQDQAYFYTEPFRAERDGPHVASVYVHGQGEGAIEIVGKELAKYTAPFSVAEGDGWKRIAVSFPAEAAEPRYLVRVRLKGRVWLDAFQVNPGTAPLPYRSERPAEVALAPLGGGLEAMRIQFEDAAPRVRWIVTGGRSGDVLKGRVVDLEGGQRPLPDVRLGEEKSQQGEWAYLPSGMAARGQFRVEAWVEDASGVPDSDPNEVVVTRIRRPRYWDQDAPDSPFGVHVEPATNMLVMAKAFGMNWARLHDTGIQALGWAHLEYAPDQWRFFDREIARYREHHLSLVGELGTAPPWRSYASKASSPPIPLARSVTGAYFEPLEQAAFADYARRVAARYRDQIGYYDVWNEPWSPLFFSIDYVKGEPPARGARAPGSFKEYWYVNSERAPEDFARLQKTAFDAVRAAAPEARIIGVNTHGSVITDGRYPGDVWSTRTAAAGALDSLDVVGFHLYTPEPIGFPGDFIETGMASCLNPLGGAAALKKAGHPVWLKEGSPVARKVGTAFYHYTLPYPDDDDYWASSDRVVRFYTRALACGADKVFLYSMGQSCYIGQAPRARIFVNEDESPHPTAAAAANFAWNIEGTHFRRLFATDKGQGTAHLFEGDTDAVLVLLPRPGAAVAVPRPDDPAIAVEDLFGNPPATATSRTSLLMRGPREAVEKLAMALEDRG